MIYPKLPLCGTKKAHRSTVMQRQPTYAPKRIRLMGYGRVWIRISACGIRIGWYIMRLRSITICISLPFCLRNGFSVRRLSLRLIIHSVPYTEPLVNKDFRKAAEIPLCINVIPEISQKAVHIVQNTTMHCLLYHIFIPAVRAMLRGNPRAVRRGRGAGTIIGAACAGRTPDRPAGSRRRRRPRSSPR